MIRYWASKMKTKRLEDNLDLTWSLSFLHLIDSRDMKTNTWDPLDSSVIMLILASTSKRNANEIRMEDESQFVRIFHSKTTCRDVLNCRLIFESDSTDLCLEVILFARSSQISHRVSKGLKNTCRTYTSQECDQDRRDSDDNKKSKDASSIILHTQAGLSQRRFSPSV